MLSTFTLLIASRFGDGYKGKTPKLGFELYALTTRTSQARSMVRGRRATGRRNPSRNKDQLPVVRVEL